MSNNVADFSFFASSLPCNAQEKEELDHKLQSFSRSLDDCQRLLEAAGINAVSLKTWIARENDNDEDITMLEMQLKQAMDTLKDHKVTG